MYFFAAVVVGDNMTLAWILLFALTQFANTVTGQACRRLFMQGLDNTQLLPFAELSGLYTLTSVIHDGFSAYQHETHTNQFFVYNSTLRALVLGRGLLLAHTSGRSLTTNVQYPYSEVITGWRVYQPTAKRLLFEFIFFSSLFIIKPYQIAKLLDQQLT